MSKQVRYGNNLATVRDADGVKGILIRDMDGSYLFRVYTGNGDFTDYSLRHSDLAVTIQDSDAAFYTIGDRHLLDHTPATLGLEEVSTEDNLEET